MGVRTANRKQIGRPETIESVFYMWRLTGDRYWQDRGWQMFTSWVEHSITESGSVYVPLGFQDKAHPILRALQIRDRRRRQCGPSQEGRQHGVFRHC